MVPAWAAAVHRNGISDGRGWRSACHVDALGALRRGDAGDDRRIAVAGGGTMTYVAIMALVVVATMVFQARGVIAVILSNPKMQVGDYDGALRITRWVSLGVQIGNNGPGGGGHDGFPGARRDRGDS